MKDVRNKYLPNSLTEPLSGSISVMVSIFSTTEGEHDGRHYCRACVVNKLDQEYLPGVVEDIEGDLAEIG